MVLQPLILISEVVRSIYVPSFNCNNDSSSHFILEYVSLSWLSSVFHVLCLMTCYGLVSMSEGSCQRSYFYCIITSYRDDYNQHEFN